MKDYPQDSLSGSDPKRVYPIFSGKWRFTLRLKTVVILLVFGGTLLATLPLQWIWWQTARQSSLQLVDTLSEHITSTVQRDWWESVSAAEAAHNVATSLIDETPTEAAIVLALRAALAASQVPSAVTFKHEIFGTVLAARDSRGETIIQIERGKTDGVWKHELPQTAWREAMSDPSSGQPAVAYDGVIAGQGRLAVFIGMDRFAALLGAKVVGKTGGAFVVDARGNIRVVPDQAPAKALQPVAEVAAAVVAARPANAVNIVEARHLTVQDASYRVAFSPLEFNGWQFVVIVPEAEFLGEIEKTAWKTLLSLLGLSLLLGMAVAMLAKRVLSEPVAALTSDLAKIEQFELEKITHRPNRLHEFDQLSLSIARMAAGLADFAKFIPTDLVRILLADGARAKLGGETRELTVMFADIADFTKISERMGTSVIEVISGYLDVVSRTVERNHGTVDKFIGDAVMAFWGAPLLDANRARNACHAALEAISDVRKLGLVDDRGEPLQIRIGIHSGIAVVGNIGSSRRLNYTAIGDTVNLASRLEGVNKVFGTSILISEETRAALGEAFVTREIVEVSVLGRTKPVRIHELLGIGISSSKPEWAQTYEKALQAYRKKMFPQAIRLLKLVLAERPQDRASSWLMALCATLHNEQLPVDWSGIVVLDSK